MTYSPWQHLGEMPDVVLVWTDDDAFLDGADARWCPDTREIYIDERLKRLVTRCALAHELAHVVRGDEPCDNQFYDLRREIAADRLASRWLLGDLSQLATELATTSTPGHAAANLRVTLDILEARVAGLTPEERRDLAGRVRAIRSGEAA